MHNFTYERIIGYGLGITFSFGVALIMESDSRESKTVGLSCMCSAAIGMLVIPKKEEDEW